MKERVRDGGNPLQKITFIPGFSKEQKVGRKCFFLINSHKWTGIDTLFRVCSKCGELNVLYPNGLAGDTMPGFLGYVDAKAGRKIGYAGFPDSQDPVEYVKWFLDEYKGEVPGPKHFQIW